MRHCGTWATEIEILMLATFLRSYIYVYSSQQMFTINCFNNSKAFTSGFRDFEK
jgi:hypothetical protein